MTAEKTANRARAHSNAPPGQKDWQRDEAERGKKKKISVWKQAGFQGSSFSNVVGPAAGSRIKRGGVAPRGRQQVQRLVGKM